MQLKKGCFKQTFLAIFGGQITNVRALFKFIFQFRQSIDFRNVTSITLFFLIKIKINIFMFLEEPTLLHLLSIVG